MATTQNYVLGKGRNFFDQFPQANLDAGILKGLGEMYFGNTPNLAYNIAKTTLDHFSAEGGIGVKDDSVDTQINRTGTIAADNIVGANVALFVNGSVSSVTTTSATATVEVLKSKKGRYFQIGVSAANPTGVRNISNVSVKTQGGSPVTQTPATNYVVDEALGRIYILDNAATMVDGTDYDVTYDVAAATREQVVSGNNSIYGALRFISDNPKGKNRDYYFPYVKLSPDGDYILKGDDWQVMGFTFDILKRDDQTAAIYIDGRPST